MPIKKTATKRATKKRIPSVKTLTKQANSYKRKLKNARKKLTKARKAIKYKKKVK